MTAEYTHRRIYAKLAEAASAVGLDVRVHSGLDGASVVGPVVEAYVVAVSQGGFQVEMWRGSGRDPYKIERFGGFDEAVTATVTAARRQPRKSSGRAQGEGS